MDRLIYNIDTRKILSHIQNAEGVADAGINLVYEGSTEEVNRFIEVLNGNFYPISAWQAKAALKLTPNPLGGTMLDAVESAIELLSEGQSKIVIQSAWKYDAVFDISSETIITIGELIGLTSENLIQLFILGSSLKI